MSHLMKWKPVGLSKGCISMSHIAATKSHPLLKTFTQAKKAKILYGEKKKKKPLPKYHFLQNKGTAFC